MRALLALVAVVAALVLLPTSGASAAEPQVAGVQTHLLWANVDAAELDRQLDAVEDLGAGMIRVDVGWSSLQESGPGSYSGWYLQRLDQVVDEAEARGIELLLTVTWTPCWASSAPDSIKLNCSGTWWKRGVQYYPPTNASHYGAALGYLADRYRGRVAGWQIWNEPNSNSYFKAPDQVGAYVRLAQAAYPAIKQADPGATVVAGSLSAPDFEFTAALYERGIKGYFDAFSIHPYSDDRSPLNEFAGHTAKYSFVRGVPAVRQEMLSHGDDKPLWLTEFGWQTSDVRDSEPWRNGVSEATQATYLKQAYEKVSEWDYVPVAIWFGLENTSANASDPGSNYGLLRSGGTAKPAYAAFREAAAALATGPQPEPEPVPAPQPEPEPQPEPDPVPAPQPEPEPRPEPDPAPDPAPQPEPEPQPEPDPAPQPDPEPQPEPDPAPQPDPDADPQPELDLGAQRHAGLLTLDGYTPANDSIEITGRRFKASAGRYKVAFRTSIDVTGPASFSELLNKRSIRHRRWKVTAKLAATGESAKIRIG